MLLEQPESVVFSTAIGESEARGSSPRKGVLAAAVSRISRLRSEFSSFASSALVASASCLLRSLSAFSSSCAKRAQKAGDRAVLGDRIERARDLGLVVGEHLTELRLEQEHHALAVGGAEPLEQRAVLAQRAGQCLGQLPVLRGQEAIHRLREVAPIPQEPLEPRHDLPVARVEVPGERLGERRLLAVDVGPELLLEVLAEGLADVQQARLLGLLVRVRQRTQPDGPCVGRRDPCAGPR